VPYIGQFKQKLLTHFLSNFQSFCDEINERVDITETELQFIDLESVTVLCQFLTSIPQYDFLVYGNKLE
jgi:hypothetical protein